jgi:hypothetical protein
MGRGGVRVALERYVCRTVFWQNTGRTQFWQSSRSEEGMCRGAAFLQSRCQSNTHFFNFFLIKNKLYTRTDDFLLQMWVSVSLCVSVSHDCSH